MVYKRSDVEVFEFNFDEIEIGKSARLVHTITQDDINGFAELTGDFNPLHVDVDFAKRTLFQKPVVHGMLSASFISTMIGTLIPGSGALWTSQTLEFINPAYAGDTIEVIATVTKKSTSTRMIALDTIVRTINGKLLVKGCSTVKSLELIKEAPTMNNDQKQKNVLVIGGNKGIGAAISKRLSAAGYGVAITANSNIELGRETLRSLKSGTGKSCLIEMNVCSETSVIEAIKKIKIELGDIHNVVFCAAPQPNPLKIEDLSSAEVENQINVQVMGAFHVVKNTITDMCNIGGGAFVFIGSIYSTGTPPVQQLAYITAKSALDGLVRALAVELGPKNIRANIVAPGMTQTEMIANLPEKSKILAKMNTPMRRLAEPDDIAGVVEFLLSSSAGHITGESIKVCGGVSM